MSSTLQPDETGRDTQRTRERRRWTDGEPRPLGFAAFRWFLAARTLGVLGNSVAPIALAFAVLDLTGSSADLGMVVAARSVANIVVVLVGGVLADRILRQVLLVGTSLAAALTRGAVAVLVLTGTATIPLLIALSIANGAVAAVSMPASSALVPETVPSAALRRANAVLRLGANLAGILGAVVGAGVVAAVGSGAGLAIDACGFACVALCFAAMRHVMRHHNIEPALAAAATGTNAAGGVHAAGGVQTGTLAAGEEQRTFSGNPSRTTLFGDLRERWSVFVSRRWIVAVVIQFCALNAALTGATVVLGPVIAGATIGRAAWGVVVGAETAGLALGAVVAIRWRPRRALGIGVGLMACTAVPLVVLGAVPRLPVLVAAFAAGGFVIELFSTAWDHALQTNVPQGLLSRVYSYDALGSMIAVPLGETVIGPIAARAGNTPTLFGCAAVIVVATIVALSVRQVRELDTGPGGMPEE